MVQVILLYLLCASSFTISKAVLNYSAPIFFIAVRMSVAGILLCLYAIYRSISLSVRKTDILLMAVMSFIHIYCAYVFDLWSLQFMPSFKSAFFFNLSPFITALFSYLFLHERMTQKKWLGLLIGCIGMLPVVVNQAAGEASMGELLFISVPELMLLVSVFSSCIGWILVKKLMKRGYHVVMLNGVSMLVGGVLAALTSLLTEHWFIQAPVSNLLYFLLLTAGIIVVCNLLYSNLYGYLLRKYSVTFIAFAGFMCPIFTAALGVIFLREHVTWHFAVALILVFIGLWVFYQDELLRTI